MISGVESGQLVSAGRVCDEEFGGLERAGVD